MDSPLSRLQRARTCSSRFVTADQCACILDEQQGFLNSSFTRPIGWVPYVRPFNFCSTDTPRLRSARLWLHSVHRASPNKGSSSSRDMGACSLHTLAYRSLRCNTRVPCRSADYNPAQDRKTSNKSPQKTVSDVVFPESGSLEDRGKDTVGGCRAAFLISLHVISLACTPKQSRQISQGAGVTTRGTAGCQ